jgi:O-antigen/teichoic acid export membrane protein
MIKYTLLKTTIIYLIGNILEKILSFLMLPLYTHYLSATDYGLLTIIQSLITINVIIFSLSLKGAASRFHFDGRSFYKKIHYGNIFLSVTLFSILGSLLLWIFKEKIFKLIGNIPVYPYIYFIIIISYGNIIFTLYQLMLQMEHKAIKFIKNNLIRFFFTTLLSIYFIVFLGKKVEGILLSSAIIFLGYLVYIYINLVKMEIKFNLNIRLIKKNLSYSIYLVPHNLASILNIFLDRFYISNMINLYSTGIYALAGQFANILSLFSTTINNAITPNILRAYKEKNYLYIKNLTNIIIVFISIVALIISFFSPEVVNFIAPKEYKNAQTIVPLLSFYGVFQMYYFLTSRILFYEQKATEFIPFITIISLLLNFIFNYFFIKFFGVKGAAIATLLSIIIVNYFSIFIGNKFIKVGFEHLKIHFFIIVSFLAANCFYVYNFLLKIIILIIMIIIFLVIEKDNNFFKFLINEVKSGKYF